VNQQKIASRYFPPPIVSTGPPIVMMNALNTVWVDDNGKRFQVSSPITNLYPPQAPAGPVQINNYDLIRAIDQEKPVFYADLTHAMVLVQIDYQILPGSAVRIVGGGAIDPFPLIPCLDSACPRAIGYRQLQPNEMVAFFVGIPTVTDLR
jgi:hypothetical protein